MGLRCCQELVQMWRHPTAYQQELGRVQISTMCVKRNLLVAGGFQGEMVCKVSELMSWLHYQLGLLCWVIEWFMTRKYNQMGVVGCNHNTYGHHDLHCFLFLDNFCCFFDKKIWEKFLILSQLILVIFGKNCQMFYIKKLKRKPWAGCSFDI
jgi:hypothetical protein